MNSQHPQLNGTKIVELEVVYMRVHLLNEGGLFKMEKYILKKMINELQFYYITR